MNNRKTNIKMSQYYLINYEQYCALELWAKDALSGLKKIIAATILEITKICQQMHEQYLNPIINHFQKYVFE